MSHIQICYNKLSNETEISLCMGSKFQTMAFFIFGPLCTLPGQNRTCASQRHPRQAQGLNGCPAQPRQCIDVPVSIISTIGAAPASMATTDSVGERDPKQLLFFVLVRFTVPLIVVPNKQVSPLYGIPPR